MSSTTTTTTTTTTIDRIERVASKQAEWRALSLQAKILLLETMIHILSNLTMDQIVDLLGIPEAKMMGFDVTTEEGKTEAVSTSMIYVVIVKGVLQRFMEAYQIQVGQIPAPTLRTEKSKNGQTVVQTLPVLAADKFGPNANNVGQVWLEENVDLKAFDVDSFLENNDNNNDNSVMVVLGAGNHSFLSTVDCLNGLFHDNTVVYLKHHGLRNHHDVLLRILMEPLIQRGYFDSELDSGMERSKQIIHHPAVARVHLTGGKATHDAIVWGNASSKSNNKTPVLKANMTSELGCVTPWIIVNQEWTPQELNHQVNHLFAALYSNAGANCNSPKVIVMPKDWPHAREFLNKLEGKMSNTPLPSAYYPGSKERWNKFREAYPNAKEYGDDSPKAMQERQLQPNATVLPWLVINDIQVDLTTDQGRQKAASEFAFWNEPFCPVVTVAYVDTLDTAVTLCNKYMFGSLSCTLVAPNMSTVEVEQAIADLRYGAVAVNVWTGMCYFSTGGTWGAYPGETLHSVESGIGQIHNHFFIPGIQKSVLKSNMVDASHPLKKDAVRARKESMAIGSFVLKPSVYGFCNLLSTSVLGLELPPRSVCLAIMAGAIGLATQKLLTSKPSSK